MINEFIVKWLWNNDSAVMKRLNDSLTVGICLDICGWTSLTTLEAERKRRSRGRSE